MITVDTMSTATLTARSDRLRDSVLALAGVPPSDVASGACLPPLARELSIMSGCIVVLHFAPHSSLRTTLLLTPLFVSPPPPPSFPPPRFPIPSHNSSSIAQLLLFTHSTLSLRSTLHRLISSHVLPASSSSLPRVLPLPPPPSLHAHSLNSAHSTRHSLARSHSRQNHRHTNNHQERKKGNKGASSHDHDEHAGGELKQKKPLLLSIQRTKNTKNDTTSGER